MIRPFQTVDSLNTVGEWVDAFNNNALASSDHTWYLGEMLYNGILYTGLETIGGAHVQTLTNLNISSASPQNLELDNFYIYFRDINKILLVDQVTFDLRSYKTGHPMFFYINSELGFRVSSEFHQEDNEVVLFRFILGTDGKFKQCYLTAQRFGSNVYDTADEFFLVHGCKPLPAGTNNLRLKLGDGNLKRSGIRIDYHQVPDVVIIRDNNIPFNLRYITTENKVDFNAATTLNVNPNKMLNYASKTLSDVPSGKFTAQRILYDVYTNCLIMQYGDASYDSLSEAMTSINNLVYPFPYNTLMFIPLGIMFIQQGCTSTNDSTKCLLVQNTNTTVTQTDSAFFAEDAYARGRLKAFQDQIDALSTQVAAASSLVNSHVANKSNPHQVTKAQVGLGNVDNLSLAQIKSSAQTDFDGRYVKKAGDTMSGALTVQSTITATGNISSSANISASQEVSTGKNYILVGGKRLYIGIKGSDARTGDYAIL